MLDWYGIIKDMFWYILQIMMNDKWIMHLIVEIEYQFILYLIWRLGTYDFISEFNTGYTIYAVITLLARCMGPTWGPTGAHRTHMGPMWATWTLLSG